ncbi:hypothetical protein JTB14_032718 [Gonioctena quinquepunctata]|nr:hypothetical protein JTB14_032718 [Gonioctena quinquepunctata]
MAHPPAPCNLYLTNFNKAETTPSLLHSHFYASLSKYQSHSHIHTDASKSDGGVTAAFLSPNISRGFKLPSACSIYSGENTHEIRHP